MLTIQVLCFIILCIAVINGDQLVDQQFTIKGSILKDICFATQNLLNEQRLNETDIKSILIHQLESSWQSNGNNQIFKETVKQGFRNVMFHDLVNFIFNLASSSAKAQSAKRFNRYNFPPLIKKPDECPSFCSIINFPSTVDFTSLSTPVMVTIDTSAFIQTLVCHGLNSSPKSNIKLLI